MLQPTALARLQVTRWEQWTLAIPRARNSCQPHSIWRVESTSPRAPRPKSVQLLRFAAAAVSLLSASERIAPLINGRHLYLLARRHLHVTTETRYTRTGWKLHFHLSASHEFNATQRELTRIQQAWESAHIL